MGKLDRQFSIHNQGYGLRIKTTSSLGIYQDHEKDRYTSKYVN